MKKTIASLILLAAAFSWTATVASAEESDHKRTAGYFNGRAWNEASDSYGTIWKVGFIMGASDGASYVETVTKAEGKLFPHSTFSEIQKALDIFYQEPANAPIPIIYAIRIFTAKVRGGTPEEIERMTSMARADSSKP